MQSPRSNAGGASPSKSVKSSGGGSVSRTSNKSRVASSQNFNPIALTASLSSPQAAFASSPPSRRIPLKDARLAPPAAAAPTSDVAKGSLLSPTGKHAASSPSFMTRPAVSGGGGGKQGRQAPVFFSSTWASFSGGRGRVVGDDDGARQGHTMMMMGEPLFEYTATVQGQASPQPKRESELGGESGGLDGTATQSNSSGSIRVGAKYTASMSLGDMLLHLYVVAVLRAHEGEPPPRHLSVIAVADDEGRSATATGGSSLLRSLNTRLGDVQGVETFTMSAADHSFAFPADSSTAQQTLADPKYTSVLGAVLTTVGWASSPLPAHGSPPPRKLVLSDPSGNYRCAVFEPKEGEQLPGSATAALQCRTKPIRVASAASPTSSLPTRSQIIQTKESSQTMEDARRQLEADHEREVDGMRSQLHRETESLSLHVRRLEEDILRKHKELSDVETAHGKREAQLAAEVERILRSCSGADRTGPDDELARRKNTPVASPPPKTMPFEGAAPAVGGFTSDRNSSASSPPSCLFSQHSAASEALLRVRRSIADGERFIESMRRRT